MRKIKRLGVFTSLWKRHRLSRYVMRHFSRMQIEGVDIIPLAVGSEGQNSAGTALVCGWDYVEAPNTPLSDKMNAGVSAMAGTVDAVLIIGSDNMLTVETVEALIDHAERGSQMVYLDDLYYYDSATDKVFYSERSMPGAGMLIQAEVLDRVDWKPWPNGINRRLDGQLINKMTVDAFPCPSQSLKNCRSKGYILVDIKSKTNMWSVDQMKDMTGRVSQVPLAELTNHFPGIRDILN